MKVSDIFTGGGPVGLILWVALLVTSVFGISLIVDSFVTVKEEKLVPPHFVSRIREAMEQGDVVKASKYCEEEDGPYSNILQAAFSSVEDGFEAVQDAVGVAADLEIEKLMQRINYLSVIGNLAPMLGLLGTVVGMIKAFASLATGGAGGANSGLLAQNISLALWTTAAGLMVAVPVLAFFYFFRNRATRVMLTVEALTLEEINVLRHAEVVED